MNPTSGQWCEASAGAVPAQLPGGCSTPLNPRPGCIVKCRASVTGALTLTSLFLNFSPQSVALQPVAIVADVADVGLMVTDIQMQGGDQEAEVTVTLGVGTGALAGTGNGRTWQLSQFTYEAVRSGMSPFPRSAQLCDSSRPLRIQVTNTTGGTLAYAYSVFFRVPPFDMRGNVNVVAS